VSFVAVKARRASYNLTSMPARDQRLLISAAFVTAALLLLGAFAGHPDLLVFAAPLYLLVVPLLAGRYVGEETLERLGRQAPTRPRRVFTGGALPGIRRTAVLLPRGGRLIAEALAVRPPPLSTAS
jgi:hypothetical protein